MARMTQREIDSTVLKLQQQGAPAALIQQRLQEKGYTTTIPMATTAPQMQAPSGQAGMSAQPVSPTVPGVFNPLKGFYEAMSGIGNALLPQSSTTAKQIGGGILQKFLTPQFDKNIQETGEASRQMLKLAQQEKDPVRKQKLITAALSISQSQSGSEQGLTDVLRESGMTPDMGLKQNIAQGMATGVELGPFFAGIGGGGTAASATAKAAAPTATGILPKATSILGRFGAGVAKGMPQAAVQGALYQGFDPNQGILSDNPGGVIERMTEGAATGAATQAAFNTIAGIGKAAGGMVTGTSKKLLKGKFAKYFGIKSGTHLDGDKATEILIGGKGPFKALPMSAKDVPGWVAGQLKATDDVFAKDKTLLSLGEILDKKNLNNPKLVSELTTQLYDGIERQALSPEVKSNLQGILAKTTVGDKLTTVERNQLKQMFDDVVSWNTSNNGSLVSDHLKHNAKVYANAIRENLRSNPLLSDALDVRQAVGVMLNKFSDAELQNIKNLAPGFFELSLGLGSVGLQDLQVAGPAAILLNRIFRNRVAMEGAYRGGRAALHAAQGTAAAASPLTGTIGEYTRRSVVNPQWGGQADEQQGQ